MTETETSVWTIAAQQLWQRIRSHPFEAPNQSVDFTRRLARDNGWTLPDARCAVEEYRRFCFLSCVSPGPMTPSEQIDEVWHLHLIHTRDYWERFCPGALGQSLHHVPTHGGAAQLHKHREQYAVTLERYGLYFGPAPRAWWPDSHARFSARTPSRRVECAKYWVILRLRRPAPMTWALGFTGLAAGLHASQAFALSANPFDWLGGEFLVLYLLLMLGSFIFMKVLRDRTREIGPGDSSNLSPFQLAYLANGPARCVDAAVAQLMANGGAEWDAEKSVLRVNKRGLHMDPPLGTVARCIEANGKPEKVLSRASIALEPIRKELQTRRLWLSEEQAWRAASISSLPLFVVAVIGVIKILVGLSRDRPVGFLIVLSLVMVVGGIIALFKRPTRSAAGDDCLRLAKQRFESTSRAPKDQDLGLAVALAGTVVLSGTAYAHYHDVRQPPSSGSGDGGGSDSGGGGDSGGSGCGGCGGGD